MQKNVGGTDRTLRLVVGTLLLAVAAATYTQRLSLALSVVLTVALVGAVAVSGFYLVTGARPNWSLASAPECHWLAAGSSTAPTISTHLTATDADPNAFVLLGYITEWYDAVRPIQRGQ
ncbi:DUF2892 domain-containing protein [Haladaptatus sp. GCM10025707]|uniref:YgaP family membrane protein n=1 Tax=Haladaptatus sp. GCM10025707 TaxID=3252658 RepID=UPI0036224165